MATSIAISVVSKLDEAVEKSPPSYGSTQYSSPGGYAAGIDKQPQTQYGGFDIQSLPPSYSEVNSERGNYQMNVTPAYTRTGKVKTWLPWSIVNLFLCLPLGIVTVILSLKARADILNNRLGEAQLKLAVILLLNLFGTIFGGLAVFSGIITGAVVGSGAMGGVSQSLRVFRE